MSESFTDVSVSVEMIMTLFMVVLSQVSTINQLKSKKKLESTEKITDC